MFSCLNMICFIKEILVTFASIWYIIFLYFYRIVFHTIFSEDNLQRGPFVSAEVILRFCMKSSETNWRMRMILECDRVPVAEELIWEVNKASQRKRERERERVERKREREREREKRVYRESERRRQTEKERRRQTEKERQTDRQKRR